jgi:predicted RNA polymerase sigma factor
MMLVCGTEGAEPEPGFDMEAATEAWVKEMDGRGVRLNRAVAVAMADGPAAGLALLAELDELLARYRLLPATRADLLRRLGRDAEAAEAYRAAPGLTESPVERAFLTRCLAEVDNARHHSTALPGTAGRSLR